MNNFYVYTHNDKYGNVRYVGKGSGNRYLSKYNRGKKYQAALLENGCNFTYHIIKDDLSEHDALELEVELFNKYVIYGFLINNKIPNKNKSEFKKEITEEITSKFYLAPEVPSGIRWKSDVIGGFGSVLIEAGSPAGSLNTNSGYYSVGVMGKSYQAHRIVYTLSTGKSAKELIDHINGDKSDNRIENLRECSHQSNMMNKRKYLRKDNNVPWGISWHSRDLRWGVHITDPSDKNSSGKSKIHCKNFNPKKYGSIKDALDAAIIYRDELLLVINKKLSEQGLPVYSSNHGGED